jgi:CubicO group peptidase (beta-lactamase class C family)
VVGTYSLPGLFEPGTSWTYSHGLDWAGLLVARVSQLDLETYFQKYIFSPLDIKDITFWPDRQPELSARVSDLFLRDPALPDGSGKAIPFKGPNMIVGATDEMGGQGVFGSLTSYLKILHSLLVDDEKLLKKDTAKLMFEPQLSEESREELQRLYASSPKHGPISIGNFPPSIKYDWGLGGLLTMEDVKEDGQIWRRKHCLNWSGMFNCFWVSNVAGLLLE